MFLFLVIFLLALFVKYQQQWLGQSSPSSLNDSADIKEVEAFVAQLKADSISHRQKFEKKKRQQRALTPFPFDPNTIDSTSLVKIGLRDWQISNLLKYRKHGGRWKNADDFSRLYGLDKKDFAQLRPYIQIKKTEKEIQREISDARRDSTFQKYPPKYEAGTTLALNKADTTALKCIPGIGSYYASKICKYRERLGGFVSVEQLKEIEGLPENIESWFVLGPQQEIKKTTINHTDFRGLVRHPYLNYEQVKSISNYIRKYGKISSLDELSNLENFSEADIQRLKPYLSFE